MEVHGEIALAPSAPVSDDPSLPLRLAAMAAELDRPIARGSLYRLADRMAPPSDPWSPATRDALVALLALGRPAVDKIESLDQHGLLVRLIPEWAAVRNKPQRNAYHRFTVDRHLLEAASLAAELTDTVERPDLLLSAPCSTTSGKVPRRPHRGRHRSRATALPHAWDSPRRTSRYWSTSCATTSCCPTPRPAGTSTTRPRSTASPGPPATARPCTSSPRSPRRTAGPPGLRPGEPGRPASWRTLSSVRTRSFRARPPRRPYRTSSWRPIAR